MCRAIEARWVVVLEKPEFTRTTYPDRYFTDTPFFGKNSTAMKITNADIASTANNASNPQEA